MKSRAVCILGMHRSGTSTISRMINLLGAYLGEESDIASPTSVNSKEFKKIHTDNPTGFWEHRAIINFHDRLLDRLESRWDTAVPLPEGWHLTEEILPFRAELIDLVKRDFSGHKLWVWKDPRTNILLKLWKDVLGELGIELSCVFAIRNPLDVARSLNKRDGFSLDKGYGIWINYLMMALQETMDIPTAFILYDNVLVDWEKELRKCSKKLQIAWPKKDRTLRAKIQSFLCNDLCHSASEINDLYNNNAPYPVIELYKEIMNSLDNQSISKNAITKLSKEFSTYSRFFQYDIKASLDLQKSMLSFKDSITEKEAYVATLNASVIKNEACIKELEASITERDSQIGSLNESTRENEACIKELEASITERDSQIGSLNESTRENEACIKELEASITERDSQIGSLNESTRENEACIKELEASITERDSQIGSLNESTRENEACIKELEASITERDSQIGSLNESTRENEACIKELEASITERDSQIGSLNESARENEACIKELEASITERDSQIKSLNESAREKETCIEGLEASITERDSQIGSLNESTRENEACIKELEASITERDSQIGSLNESARENEACIKELEASITERDSQIKSLNESAREKETCIEGLEASITERDSQIKSLNESAREKEACIEGLEASITEKDSQIGSLNVAVREKEVLLTQIYNSTGWKALLRYYKSRDLVLPLGSIRRKTVKFFFLLPSMITGSNIKKSTQHFKKHGLKSFIVKTRETVTKKVTGEAEMRGVAVIEKTSLTVNHYATQAGGSSLIEAISNIKAGQYDVLIFPVIDWHFRIQRPQHLAKEMGKMGCRVIYLSTTFYESDNPTFRILESPEKNVFILQIGFPGPHPNIYIDRTDGKHLQSLGKALLDFYSRCGIKSAVGIVNLPFWRRIVESLPGTLLVYDCMDYHAGFSTNSEAMLGEEELLLKSADLVITASARLSEIVANEADNVLIRNAGEIDFFAKQPESLKIETNRPVVGYYGAIAEWFDMDLIIKAARYYPEWNFVLVGAVTDQDTEEAASLPNVRFTGEVPYKDLPGYLYAFDVCMIPFKICELTLCTNPVKVYEYCAAGKPVVSSSMPELMEIDDIVYVADGSDEFIEKLALAMSEREDKSLAKKRSQWASQHDWSGRADLLHESIKSTFPKVSVIVLTYNNLGFTQACLSSLERHTHYLNWELIIVDNASTDGTPEYLKDYSTRYNHVKIVLNEKNLGFSAGNNVGLREAKGEYLVILNNDTYVTDGWLLGLIRHLRKCPDIGLVGPVTNNIGNEARIEIQYANMEDMSEQAQRYTSAHPRELFYINTLGFFCVAMSRKVYDKVGPMDEAFGVGFFEDDDYCKRVHEAGFKVAVSEDVFVHHHLSGSFNLLKEGERQKLFEKNKKVYEEKWGAWVPHKYREERSKSSLTDGGYN